MVKKNNKAIDSKINVILNTAGQEYKGEGESVLEAVENLGLDWQNIKAKGVLNIFRGGQKVEKLFYLKPLRMFFANKLRRVGFVRQLEDLLNVAPDIR